MISALGGVEGQHVGTGCPADRLGERTGALEEGDLRALRCRRVARREAAVVAGDARAARECPRRAGRVVLELAGPHLHLLETRVSDRGGADLCQGDLVDEGRVASPGAVQSLERERVRPGVTVNAAVE